MTTYITKGHSNKTGRDFMALLRPSADMTFIDADAYQTLADGGAVSISLRDYSQMLREAIEFYELNMKEAK